MIYFDSVDFHRCTHNICNKSRIWDYYDQWNCPTRYVNRLHSTHWSLSVNKTAVGSLALDSALKRMTGCTCWLMSRNSLVPEEDSYCLQIQAWMSVTLILLFKGGIVTTDDRTTSKSATSAPTTTTLSLRGRDRWLFILNFFVHIKRPDLLNESSLVLHANNKCITILL